MSLTVAIRESFSWGVNWRTGRKELMRDGLHQTTVNGTPISIVEDWAADDTDRMIEHIKASRSDEEYEELRQQAPMCAGPGCLRPRPRLGNECDLCLVGRLPAR